MPVAFRPRGAETPKYAPERDIAYLGPTLILGAIHALDHRGPLLDKLVELHGITNEQIIAATGQLGDAQSLFVSNNMPVENLEAALRTAGFLDQPPVVQGLIFASLGMALMGAFFVSVRDITFQDEDSPVEKQLAELIVGGRALCCRLGAPAPDLDEVQVKCQESLQRLENARSKIRALENEMARDVARIAKLELEKEWLSHSGPLAAILRWWKRVRS